MGDFLVWDQNKANILSDDDYQNDTSRLNGAVAGIYEADLHNKFAYQISTMVTALAESLTEKGYVVSDAVIADLKAVLAKIVTSDYANQFTVSQQLKGSSVLWRFSDTGVGGKEWGIRSGNGTLEFCENTGTEVIPIWTVRSQIGSAPTAQARNIIINGSARINQRVTPFALVNNVYGICADRLYGMASGVTVGGGTFGQSASANCGVTGYAFKFSNVTITGPGVIRARYRIESKDAAQFRNQIASFSCRTYQDSGVISYRIYIRKANSVDNFTVVSAISDSGLISVPSAAETAIKYENISMGDCSNGIEISIEISCGAISSRSFELTELQFESGSLATQYELRFIQQELSLCQRYYNKTFPLDIAPADGLDLPDGAGAIVSSPLDSPMQMWFYPVAMRSSPAIKLFSPSPLGVPGQWLSGDGLYVTANAGIRHCDTKSTLIYNNEVVVPMGTYNIQATAESEI